MNRHDWMRIVERKSIQVTKDSKTETSVIGREKKTLKITFASLMKNGNDNGDYKSNGEFERNLLKQISFHSLKSMSTIFFLLP